MNKQKITISVISGLLVVGSFVAPAFAGDDKHDNSMNMNHDQHMQMDNSDTRWWNHDWKKDWKWNFRDENSDRKLSATMSGSQEVPGPGDSDAKGNAQVRVKPGQEQVCVEISVQNIEQATMAHIHKGAKGVAGPVVVTLPTPDAQGHADACVSASKDVLKEIKNNASDYYVNVHNAAYPDGAVRGQLHN